MQVANIHECRLEASPSTVGLLLDSLASDNDLLWPASHWPPIRFDRPLGVGADGGHGPIRYRIVEYQPGLRVRFRFTRPRGFDGHHWLEVQPDGDHGTILRHIISTRVTGRARLAWLLIIRPLHDALIEDAFSRARTAVGMPAKRPPWSLWVRLLQIIRNRQPAS